MHEAETGKRYRRITLDGTVYKFVYHRPHDLCDRYNILIFEDLNLQGMKALWGRKVSDLGLAQFLNVLKWVALKRGERLVFIDRLERTTGKCSGCGHEQSLTLAERVFMCENCGLSLDRDYTAALNILAAGRRLILSQSSPEDGAAALLRYHRSAKAALLERARGVRARPVR